MSHSALWRLLSLTSNGLRVKVWDEWWRAEMEEGEGTGCIWANGKCCRSFGYDY